MMALLSGGYGDNEIRELKLNLAEAAVNPDPTQLRSALAQIVAQMTQGNSLVSLFPELVKICATTDLPSKKLVYLYMAGCAHEQPRLALLVINCLLKDCQDANPMGRGLALRTLCSLRLPLLMEYIGAPLLSGLKDKSSYVRRIAVLGCLRAYKLNSSFIEEGNIVDQLCELLADCDNLVVVNALCVLQELQGRVHVSQHMAHQLLNRLHSMSEWGQIKALQFLLLYQPKTEEEIFDIMNMVDRCLRHPNSGVSFGAIRLMLHLICTRSLPQVRRDVMRNLKGLLLCHLSSDQPALVFAALSHLEWLYKRLPQGLTKYYKKFYCKYNEPTYIRCKRIDLIVRLTSESNIAEIVGELSVYCTDVSTRLGRHAVHALATISQLSHLYTPLCMDALMELLQLGIDYLSSAILIEMQGLLSLEGKFQDYAAPVLDIVPACWSSVDDEEGRCAMIWLLGHHGQKLPDAPYLLESVIDNIMEETSSKVKVHLLTATAKLFCSRPAECQDSLALLIQFFVVTEKDVVLQEKALLYYKLLHADTDKARSILCSSHQLRTLATPETQHRKESFFNSFRNLLDKGDAGKSHDKMPQPDIRIAPGITPSHQYFRTVEEGTLVDLGVDEAEVSSPFSILDSASAVVEESYIATNGIATQIEGALNHSLDVVNRTDAAHNVLCHLDPNQIQQQKDPCLDNAYEESVKWNSSLGKQRSSERTFSASDTNDLHDVISISDGAGSQPREQELVSSSIACGVSFSTGKDEEAMLSESPDVSNQIVGTVKKSSLSLHGPSRGTLDVQEGDACCETIEAGMSKNDAVPLLFDPNSSLSPQAFEEKWMSWTTSKMFETRTEDQVGKPADILERFNQSGFKTMACTPGDTEPWRAFLYAQTKYRELFLLEVTTRQNEGIAAVCVKYKEKVSDASLCQVASLCKAAL